MSINTITVTGIDEFTDLDAARHLLEGPDVEIGILASMTPEGRNRYPRLEWITEAIQGLRPIAVSIHICGRGARRCLMGGQFDRWFGWGAALRMQVNGVVQAEELREICRRFPCVEVITQHTAANASLATIKTGRNHALLVDGSGGRGIAPSSWVAPETTKCVGFAGGLCAESLPGAVKEIRAIARPGWWVDMEGRLRDEADHFDVKRAAAAIACFREIAAQGVA